MLLHCEGCVQDLVPDSKSAPHWTNSYASYGQQDSLNHSNKTLMLPRLAYTVLIYVGMTQVQKISPCLQQYSDYFDLVSVR